LLRIAGDRRAVSAGCRLGVAEDLNPFVDLFSESSLSMKPSISIAPKKWPMPLPTLRAARDLLLPRLMSEKIAA